ncbi:MAG: winged helix-turn-helix transcriptional regulator [Oscillospiraceae bacterium]|nr:winged helix-turn-helix transcriptional regulator [Oscillospiraceae bacterium]
MTSKSKEKLYEKWKEKSADRFAWNHDDNLELNGEIYTAGEIRFLRYIQENPDKTSIQLARESGKTRGTVSLIMKRLTEKNLAFFQDDPDHRKRKKIVITPLGLEVCRLRTDKDMKFIKGVVTQLEAKYSQEEMMSILPAICDLLSFIK